MARLETLLCEAGIESNESTTIEALRQEVARLRKALVAPEAREGATGARPADTRRRRTAVERSPDQKDTIRTLRKEITRLNNEVVRRDKQLLQPEQAPRPLTDGSNRGRCAFVAGRLSSRRQGNFP